MRGIQFFGLKERMMKGQGQWALHQRYSRTLLLVPVLAVTAIALSKFIRTSFGVYLKHQALVDGYYQYKLEQKYDESTVSKSPVESKKAVADNRLFQQSLRALSDAEASST